MADNAKIRSGSDRPDPAAAGNSNAPRDMDTPRRPGQQGVEAEHRPGPSPNSAHPTGPHAPYEESDPQGLAAGKHR